METAYSKKVRHGSPEDRGSADKYYGRVYDPHYFTGATRNSECINWQDMTEDETAQYKKGWNEQTYQKDWGTENWTEDWTEDWIEDDS